MPSSKILFKWLCYSQGSYTLITALWALIDIRSFMLVTGPKTDIWLVKTVAILLLPIGTCILLGIFLKQDQWIVLLIASMTALGLVAIDFYYTINGTISIIYQLDGFLELLFFIGWLIIFLREKKYRRIHT